MKRVTLGLNVLSIATALMAAVFWWRSAKVPIPSIDLHYDQTAPEFTGALNLQSNLSATAAMWAAASAALQAIAMGVTVAKK